MPDDSLLDLAEYISEELEGHVLSHEFMKDELVITANTDSIVPVIQFLRDARECGFSVLCDICGVDYPDRAERFEVVYTMLSMRQNNRARVRIAVEEDQIVPSVTGLFSSALWYEREIWDMYGVLFSGNPDLRRILTDYGFKGHPQRKDFPLTGHVELRYDAEFKRVVYEPVKLDQEFRNFDFESPWEGLTDIQNLGAEKGVIPPHGWKCTNKKLCVDDEIKGIPELDDNLLLEEDEANASE